MLALKNFEQRVFEMIHKGFVVLDDAFRKEQYAELDTPDKYILPLGSTAYLIDSLGRGERVSLARLSKEIDALEPCLLHYVDYAYSYPAKVDNLYVWPMGITYMHKIDTTFLVFVFDNERYCHVDVKCFGNRTILTTKPLQPISPMYQEAMSSQKLKKLAVGVNVCDYLEVTL